MGVSVGRRSPNQNPVKSALDQIMGFMPMMYASYAVFLYRYLLDSIGRGKKRPK